MAVEVRVCPDGVEAAVVVLEDTQQALMVERSSSRGHHNHVQILESQL